MTLQQASAPDSDVGRDRQLSARYLDQELEGMEGSAGTLPLIFLAVAAFLLNVVVGRTMERQRGEIAVLRACGYGNLTLGPHYLAMATLVAAVGCALGIARRTPVQVGRRNGLQAQLLGGLEVGDQVVVYPPPELRDGDRAAPVGGV